MPALSPSTSPYREYLPLLERLLQAALGYDRYSERIIEAKAKISALEQAASAKPH
jgi:hypothetical protein